MTREEAIKRIQEHMIIYGKKEPRAIYITKALQMAIKALEQQPILDKIRAEIMSKDGLEEALEIIDKYKAESEE